MQVTGSMDRYRNCPARCNTSVLSSPNVLEMMRRTHHPMLGREARRRSNLGTRDRLFIPKFRESDR